MISRSSSFKCVERVVQPALQFLMDRRRRRGLFGIDKLRDELNRRLIGPGRRLNRLFAVDAPPLRLPMPAMRVDDPILGQVPQPQVKRHRRVLQILGQPLIGFEQHILNDVAGIDAASQHGVEPQVDDLPQRLAELAEQSVDGRGLAASGVVEQSSGFLVVRPHGESIVVLPPYSSGPLLLEINASPGQLDERRRR